MPRPLGIFHAATCRDAASLERDGQLYFDIHRLSGDDAFEVMFPDGIWMLARSEDLEGVIPMSRGESADTPQRQPE